MPSEPQTDDGAFLQERDDRSLLRFITCGSVDDGKSTLMGRLLYESGASLDDQPAALRADSNPIRPAGNGVHFALLLDGPPAHADAGLPVRVAHP